MKNLRLFKLGFLIAILFGASTVFADINPINTLETPRATSCGLYDVDLSVQQYINVANISMTLDINSLSSAYTGITLNPAIAGAVTYLNQAGELKLGWSSDPAPTGITLPDNTILFTLHFDVTALWGTSHDLAWDDVLTIDCELSGPNGAPIYPDYWNDLHWDIQNQMSLTETHTDYECPLSPTGAIDLTVAGGVAPYTYAWTGPNGFTATTEDLSGLFPGTYCVIVTDADFCVTSPTFCVTIVQNDNPAPVVPDDVAVTVECLADAVPPSLPDVYDHCGTLLTPVLVMTDSPNPISCEGTREYAYTYTDYQPKSSTWKYTYTIQHSTPPAEVGGPVEIASTVECVTDAVAPTLPVFEDVCGNVLSPAGPTMSGDYVDCEGTKIYTYTYTDCAGLATDWVYTYTIEHSTPPSEFGNPVSTGITVECIADAVAPTTLPIVKDVCGVLIDAPTPVESGTYVDCEGTKIYTYTYTDCAGLDFVWAYTYTIEHSTPPAEVGGPIANSSTIECAVDAVLPALPVFADVCGNVLTPSAAAPGGTYTDCEGTITYTFTYVDCAGLSTDWVYTYNVVHSTTPDEVGGPVATASTVECAVDATAPTTLPVVEDVCGNVIPAPAPDLGGSYVDCEGTKTYTYTYTDCAGLDYVWVYTYTIEHSTPPAEDGGPVATGTTIECQADAVEPTTLPVVIDVCGVVLDAPVPVMSSPVNCEGAITFTYTYTDCAGLDFVWVYTYTIEHSTAPDEVGGPVEIASTVECEADAVAPGTVYQAGFAGDFDPVNWTLNTNGGNGSVDVSGAPASIELTGSDDGSWTSNITSYETIIPIDGTVSFDWNYTTIDTPGYDAFGYILDGNAYALTWVPGGSSFSINVTQGASFGFIVYSDDNFGGPGVAITNAFLFSSPAFPVVADVCGEILNPVGPVVTGDYNGCEGTKIYTYTYTDCAGLDFVWAYTYTIDLLGFTIADDDGETITCSTELYTPTPPVEYDNCGNLINPTGPTISATPPCNGDVTYVWNYADCSGNNLDWTYTFTIDDNIAPWIIAPDDITVYMNDGCFATGIGLGAPQKGDNCQNQLFVTTDGLVSYPEGPTTVTWTVTDCAGNSSSDTQVVTVIRNNLSGTMTYNNGPTFGPNKILNNVEVTIMPGGATSTTDVFGHYSFTGLCAGTYTLAITNNNKPGGGVNITDAGQTMVFGAVSNPNPIEKVNWLAGDVDQSSAINTFDVLGIFNKFVFGVPFGNDWNYYWAGEMTNNANTAPILPMSVVIGGGNSSMDIYGQCTGDFNGNFAPGTMKSADESLSMEYGQYMLVDSDTEFELPINAGMDMRIGAVSLILDIPTDDVEITDVFLTSTPDDSQLMYNVSGDELRIGWTTLAPIWVNKGEGLVTLKVRIKGSTEEGIYFSLADSYLNELADGDYDVIDNAKLTVDIPSTSALGFGQNSELAENIKLNNQPNPFMGSTTLTYSIPSDGEVILEVYDIVGNKMEVLVNKTQSAGDYSLKLNADGYQPGIYTAFLKYKTKDLVVTRAIKMINR